MSGFYASAGGWKRNHMTENRFLLDLFPWAPRPLIVLALLAAAISVAVIVHLVLWSIFQRFFGARYPFLREIITRTRAISNFAFIMVAVSAAVPLAPLHAHVIDGINRVLDHGHRVSRNQVGDLAPQGCKPRIGVERLSWLEHAAIVVQKNRASRRTL